jgi:hypothetical protein
MFQVLGTQIASLPFTGDDFELNCPITRLIRVCVRDGTRDVNTALDVDGCD